MRRNLAERGARGSPQAIGVAHSLAANRTDIKQEPGQSGQASEKS
jgi:hypothetical protein